MDIVYSYLNVELFFSYIFCKQTSAFVHINSKCIKFQKTLSCYRLFINGFTTEVSKLKGWPANFIPWYIFNWPVATYKTAMEYMANS